MHATKTFTEAVGVRLKKVRLAVGLSQGEAAVDMGITQSSLSRIERGIQNPRLSALEGVWRFLEKNEGAKGIDLERVIAEVKESGELEALVRRIVLEL